MAEVEAVCRGCERVFVPSSRKQRFCSEVCYEANGREKETHFAPWLERVPVMTDEEYAIVALADARETVANCAAASVVVMRRARLVTEARLAWIEEHREEMPVEEDEDDDY